jgi:hypothetical protein
MSFMVRYGVFSSVVVTLLAGCGDSTAPRNVDFSGTWIAATSTNRYSAGLRMTLTEDADGSVHGTWTRECSEAGCPQIGTIDVIAHDVHTDALELKFEGYLFCAATHAGTCLTFTVGFRGAPGGPNRLVGSLTPWAPEFAPVTFER